MSELFVMCGIPRSGKTTVANRVAKMSSNNAVVISADAMREKYFGSESCLYDKKLLLKDYNLRRFESGDSEKDWKIVGNAFVFKKMESAAREALKEGKDVIYDATSITARDRKLVLNALRGLFDSAHIVYIDCPLETALQRNSHCSRKVPEDVITRMYRRLEVPGEADLDPGFLYDEIITIKM